VATYVALLTPSSNRVYAGAAPAVTSAELRVLGRQALGATVTDVRPTSIAGVPYLEISLDGPPRAEVLGQLASVHALFCPEGALLRPVPLTRTERFDDDLLSIPKYPGKTNEQLTRVLLNITLASTAWAPDMASRRFSVLDPMAGRGTTLSWALSLGHDAAGVEIEGREVEAYSTFLRTYLRRKRVKHQIDLHPVRRGGKHVADLLEAQLSADKDAYRAGERQSLELYVADTMSTGDLFGRRRFEAIVTDAPYGVAHGSRSGGAGAGHGAGHGAGRGVGHGAGRGVGRGAGRDRSPAAILAAAIPGWASVLRTGGALGIAWNTHGLARQDLAQICADAGLAVCDDGPYLELAHRVDAGIHRDLLVARKTSA